MIMDDLVTAGVSVAATAEGSVTVRAGGLVTVTVDGSVTVTVDGSASVMVGGSATVAVGEGPTTTVVWLGTGETGTVTVVEVSVSGVGGSTTENGVDTPDNKSDSSPGSVAGSDVDIAGGCRARVRLSGAVLSIYIYISGRLRVAANTRVVAIDRTTGWYCEAREGRYSSYDIAIDERIYSTKNEHDVDE